MVSDKYQLARHQFPSRVRCRYYVEYYRSRNSRLRHQEWEVASGSLWRGAGLHVDVSEFAPHALTLGTSVAFKVHGWVRAFERLQSTEENRELFQVSSCPASPLIPVPIAPHPPKHKHQSSASLGFTLVYSIALSLRSTLAFLAEQAASTG